VTLAVNLNARLLEPVTDSLIQRDHALNHLLNAAEGADQGGEVPAVALSLPDDQQKLDHAYWRGTISRRLCAAQVWGKSSPATGRGLVKSRITGSGTEQHLMLP